MCILNAQKIALDKNVKCINNAPLLSSTKNKPHPCIRTLLMGETVNKPKLTQILNKVHNKTHSLVKSIALYTQKLHILKN